MGKYGEEGVIRKARRCPTPGEMTTVGSKQWLCIRLLLSNRQQMKRPCPDILDPGSAVATVFHLREKTRGRDHSNIISISTGITRRKGKLVQIKRK